MDNEKSKKVLQVYLDINLVNLIERDQKIRGITASDWVRQILTNYYIKDLANFGKGPDHDNQ